MEPVKCDGKMREQVEVENKVRREYPLKYSQMTTNDANYFYNQKKTNMEIRNQQNTGKHVEKCPYEYTGHGDSYFVSKDMYNSLVGTCRCGRKKTEGHMIKCLQKVKNIYLSDDEEDENKNHRIERPLPSTSSGMIGWPQIKYKNLERMTYYISPKYTMVGPKVQEHPYSNIFIG